MLPAWAVALHRQYLREHDAKIVGRLHLFEAVIEQAGYPTITVRNQLFNEGELIVAQMAYNNVNNFPASFFGRLYNDVPVDTDTLLTLTGEPSGNGYAAQSWARGVVDFAAAATVGGQAEAVAVIKTFTGTGAGYGPVTAFVLATTSDNSGKAFAWFPLETPRTITPAAPLQVRPKGIFRGESS